MNYQNLDTDAVIIGAGPAGAATSVFLTKYQIPHIVLEKESFPRDKICGDACSGKTTFVLRKANPDWLKEIHQQQDLFLPVYGMIVGSPAGRSFHIPFYPVPHPGEPAPGFTSARVHFDHFLFEKLHSPHAQVLLKTRVDKIERQNGKILVDAIQNGQHLQIKAKLLIGADGAQGMVRRSFLPGDDQPKVSVVGLRAYYTGVTGMHQENYIELHFLPELLPYYLWIFPLPNGVANVGVGMYSDKIRREKINLKELMIHAIQNNSSIKSRFTNATLIGKIQGYGLPIFSKEATISGDHFLLVGDAAHLIDPFTGEGIGNALYSGMKAADAVKSCLESNQFHSQFIKAHYEEPLYQRMKSELRTSLTLHRLCRHKWLFNLITRKAAKSPALAKMISSMMSDIDLRSHLNNPFFYLRIILNL